MISPLAHNIRTQVDRYLAGDLALSAFNDWLWSATTDIETLDDPEAQELTYELILRLAEYEHGDWTKAELNDRFRAAIAALTPVAAGD